jgi:hypothetical protein
MAHTLTAAQEKRFAEILQRIARGESLRAACREIPNCETDSTVRGWCTENEEMSAQMTRARASGCHAIAEECLEIADGSGDSKTKWVRIETRLKLLGKWFPLVYGDAVRHTGADGAGPITIVVHRGESPEVDGMKRALPAPQADTSE